tara:strand:- start:1776 stop:2945 length:1170 start_codon:yes stop_codon:yes gene_type:complete
MKTIFVVITARPSYSRIKTYLEELKISKNYDLKIVLASSSLVRNYGDLRTILKEDGFVVNYEISNMMSPNGLISMSKTTALQIYELSTIFINEKPDAVVTIADRFETIATSIAAAYSNIPLIHVQGGEITGNIDEKTRHANTKLADLHLVSTNLARERVIQMGEDPSKVFNCGCPSIDLAKKAIQSDFNIKDIIDSYSGIGNLKDEYYKNYIVILQHPTTNNFEKSESEITITLEACLKYNKQVFVFWPNADAGTDGTSKGIRKFREKYNPNNFSFHKNFKPNDFVRLIHNSDFLIGNSSAGIRETSYLKIPTINIGDRQINRDRGSNVFDCDYDSEQIHNCIKNILNKNHKIDSNLIYGDGSAAIKMIEAMNNFDYSFTKTFKSVNEK